MLGSRWHLSTLSLLATRIVSQFMNPPPPDGGQMTNPEPTENPTPDFSQNLNWPIGSTQQLQWVEDVGTYNVRLYQRFVSEQFPDMNGYVYSPVGNGTGNQTYSWTVQAGPSFLPNTGFSDQGSEVFFFEIDPIQSSGEKIQSHYFNITGSDPNAGGPDSTVSAPPSMGSQPSMTPAYSSPAATATQQNSQGSTEMSPSPPGLSESDKLGLGLGLGIGIPIILLLGILAGVNIARLRRDPVSAHGTSSGQQNPADSTTEDATHRSAEAQNMQQRSQIPTQYYDPGEPVGASNQKPTQSERYG